MATNEAGYQPQTLRPLTRWAAFAGIALNGSAKVAVCDIPDLPAFKRMAV